MRGDDGEKGDPGEPGRMGLPGKNVCIKHDQILVCVSL